MSDIIAHATKKKHRARREFAKQLMEAIKEKRRSEELPSDRQSRGHKRTTGLNGTAEERVVAA
jgi:hypothetical protein